MSLHNAEMRRHKRIKPRDQVRYRPMGPGARDRRLALAPREEQRG